MSFRLGVFSVLVVALAVPGLARAEHDNKASAAAPAQPVSTAAPAPDPARLCDKAAAPGPEAGTLAVSAVVVKGAKPIQDPVAWTITRISGNCRGQLIATGTAPTFTAKLDPGTYRVKAVYETAEASDQVTVIKKQTVHKQIDLRVATATFRLIPNAGAPAIEEPVSWDVFQYVKGNGGHGRQIAHGDSPHQRFMLGEGAYVVRASYNGTVTELVVPAKAGDTFNYTVNLYSGQVTLKAVDKTKKALKGDVVYEIARAKVGQDGQHEVLARKVSPTEPLMLREGKYLVTARAGDKVGTKEIEVKAGKTKAVVVTLF